MGFITSLVGMLSATSSIIARNDINMANIDDHIIDKDYTPTHSETDIDDLKAWLVARIGAGIVVF